MRQDTPSYNKEGAGTAKPDKFAVVLNVILAAGPHLIRAFQAAAKAMGAKTSAAPGAKPAARRKK